MSKVQALSLASKIVRYDQPNWSILARQNAPKEALAAKVFVK